MFTNKDLKNSSWFQHLHLSEMNWVHYIHTLPVKSCAEAMTSQDLLSERTC